MNGYKAFYRGRETEVYADTSFAAQESAAKKFKARRSFEVTVVLCEKDTDGATAGTPVVHAPQAVCP